MSVENDFRKAEAKMEGVANKVGEVGDRQASWIRQNKGKFLMLFGAAMLALVAFYNYFY